MGDTERHCVEAMTESQKNINEADSFTLIGFDKWSAISILRDPHIIHFPQRIFTL
jgi:hypothetical protein